MEKTHKISSKKRKRTNYPKTKVLSKKNKIKCINELHQKALSLFDSKSFDDYKELEDKVIKIFDLDENINKKYLELLNDFYKGQKADIDKGTNGESNKIAENFYTYILTLNYEDRIKIYNDFNYFKKGEIFEGDEKFFYKKKMKVIFSEMVKMLIKLKDLKVPSDNFNKILDNYPIPSSKKKNLIPSLFGSEEFRYSTYITEISSIIKETVNDKEKGKKINQYINLFILSLTKFEDYLTLDPNNYQEDYIRYILFCISSVFKYSKNVNNLLSNITEILNKCAKFLYEPIAIKKAKILLIKEYIIDKDFDIDKLTEDSIINILYEGKNYKCKISDHYFYFCESKFEVIDIIINKNKYSFSYYQDNNCLLGNKDLDQKFDDYFKKILKSQINQEYINHLEGLQDYNYIFTEDKFLNEINIKYTMMPIKELSGLTTKDYFTVYISNELDLEEIETIIVKLGGKLITKLNEIVNHIYRLIIHINDSKIPLKTPIKIFKDDKLDNEEKFNNLIDGGDKYEILVFGEKISKLYLSSTLFIFNDNNWNNNNIKTFSENFKKSNIFIKDVDIKKLAKDYNILINNNEFLNSIQKEFNINFENIESDWMKKEQYIVPRISFDKESYQYINIGFCGTHLLYHDD